MIRPAIGICAAWDLAAWSFWRQQAAVVAGSYLDVVRRAGGIAVALPPQQLGEGEAAALLDRVDGLLLIGGSDLDPDCYGEISSAETEETSPLRDRFEIALVGSALESNLPVLGICRGLQILNVATGGKLHQDLIAAGFGDHRPAAGRLDGPTEHEIEVVADSLLGGYGKSTVWRVNSHHHQGVSELGHGGTVVARSLPDGVVEAVEWREYRHVLGVQWHPEALELDATVSDLVRAATPRTSVTTLAK
jgi:putative glutamine amidotransferase